VYRIRPIKTQDFEGFKQIAIASGPGFTSLPVDDDRLQQKIERSEQSFISDIVRPSDESYLFVLELLPGEGSSEGELVGTTGIEAGVGLSVPLYHYHISTVVHHSPQLDIYKPARVLTLCNDYTGATEICTLFLHKQHRVGLNGRFLSRVRFLFMADYRERFSELVIAEMRGSAGKNDVSPFWKWLEEHFFGIDFPTADRLIGIGQKDFVAQLMPKYPIYLNLLSKEAQSVVAQVHEFTKPALRLLQKEGFKHKGYIDLFDAGPTVEAYLDEVATVKNSQRCQVQIGQPAQGNPVAITNRKLVNFRAVYTEYSELDLEHSKLIISEETAEQIDVHSGDLVRFCYL
jgi:arginine N-succinyltransferase